MAYYPPSTQTPSMCYHYLAILMLQFLSHLYSCQRQGVEGAIANHSSPHSWCREGGYGPMTFIMLPWWVMAVAPVGVGCATIAGSKVEFPGIGNNIEEFGCCLEGVA